jgi:hypothetical protein
LIIKDFDQIKLKTSKIEDDEISSTTSHNIEQIKINLIKRTTSIANK